MILTKNDLVCLVTDDSISPKDYLSSKINVLNRPFFYYSVDQGKTISIVSCIENERDSKFGIMPFYNNLIYSRPLNIVDNIHGFMRNCSVRSIQFIRMF